MNASIARYASCFALLNLAVAAAADEPVQAQPTFGIRAGETMPFFVADFRYGEHKDHGGCPAVIISNQKAKGVIVLARTVDDHVLALAKALEEKKVVDGTEVLSFIIKTGEPDLSLADRCAKTGLMVTSVGTIRDQSLQTLAKRGLEKDIDLAVLFLDRKAVKASHLFKAGEFTADKRQELVAAAEASFAAR